MGDTLKLAWRSQEWVKNSISKWISGRKRNVWKSSIKPVKKNTIENISNILNQEDRILYI